MHMAIGHRAMKPGLQLWMVFGCAWGYSGGRVESRLPTEGSVFEGRVVVVGGSGRGRGRRGDIVERWGSKTACTVSMVSGPLAAALHVVC